MTFLLSSQNVTGYIASHSLWTQEEQAQVKIEPRGGKNFNMLLSLPDNRQLLIKQERYDRHGKTAGEFLHEWRIQEFLQRFSQLNFIRPWVSEVLHFDPENSIIVFNYLNDYSDLMDFYLKENTFPTTIAATLGSMLATIHRLSLDHQDYRDFFCQNSQEEAVNPASRLFLGLERISPEVFSEVPADGLKFFTLYQRYDSLGQAIAELGEAFEPCCLAHNDLKLNNILLSNDWQQAETPPTSLTTKIHIIDWERSAWGDPAFDLGMLLASYLQLWLCSLVTSSSMAIEESLRLATTPLELVQPSIAALTRAYFANFPEILERRPDFLRRTIQFGGLALIHTIQSMLQYQKSFGNTGICILQVAKSLLCRPDASIPTVFGIRESELVGAGLTELSVVLQ